MAHWNNAPVWTPDIGDIVRCHDGGQYIASDIQANGDGVWQAVLAPRYQVGTFQYSFADHWVLIDWIPLGD